jgi:integrase
MRRLEADIFPEMGRRPIAEIDAPEILDALRKVEARGTLETARRLRQVISAVFRFAIVERRAKRDPSADLKGALVPPAPAQHHKAMPRNELPNFFRAVESYDGDARTRLALKLIVQTFVRTKELRGARWGEFENLDGAEPQWRIPAERMKKRREHIVPLSRQAVATLKELRALPGSDATPHLFPSPSRDGFISDNTLLFAMYRLGYHGRATVHGFRGMASTILNETGFNSDHIEMQLAHVERNKVRAAYNAAQWLPDRRRMMQWWADHLDALVTSAELH